MKRRQNRLQTGKVSHSRWLAYATASAATALAGSHSAEAAIHYSGLVNVPFSPHKDRTKTLSGLKFSHYFPDAALGTAMIFPNCYASVRGIPWGSSFGYVSKLSFGQNISSGSFPIYCFSNKGVLAGGDSFGFWRDPGIGFIGFRVNNSGGFQYGWIRVRMGGAPLNGFIVLDYAYADPGEPISAGQRSRNEDLPPKQGSLGWLALGAVGLLAWRNNRSQAARFEDA